MQIIMSTAQLLQTYKIKYRSEMLLITIKKIILNQKNIFFYSNLLISHVLFL